MHWSDMPFWGWGGWLGSTLAVLVLVGGVLVLLFLLQRRPGERDTAERILAERFARGEIDEEEYRRRRQALRG